MHFYYLPALSVGVVSVKPFPYCVCRGVPMGFPTAGRLFGD
jgi:hypothetical protein